MSGGNFVPGPMGLFNDWQDNFVIKVNAFKSGWDLSANAEWTQLTGTGNVKQARFTAAWNIVKTKEFLHSDEVELKTARQVYESGKANDATDTSLRLYIKRYITNNKLVTDKQKKAMRLTVADTILTAATDPGGKAIGPRLSLKSKDHLLQKITVTYPGTKSKKKRKGVKDVMLYLFVQAASLTTTPSYSQLVYLGDMERGIYTAHFTDVQEGYKAFYAMREKGSKKGSPLGNWTPIISETI